MLKRSSICFFLFFLLSNLSYSQKINKIVKVSNFITKESIIRGIIGIFILIFIAFLLSNNKKKINWKLVIIGIFTQIFLAMAILKGENLYFTFGENQFNLNFIRIIFDLGGKIFTKILSFSLIGSKFLLGNLMNTNTYGFIFGFQVLPTIIFFSALTSLLFYLGIIQIIIKFFSNFFSMIIKISGAESLAVCANIFLGQTEAPLIIKSYLKNMSSSEIFLVMTAGMSTVAGGVLAAYINFLGGSNIMLQEFYAKHLLAASVMAAPGAVAIAKIIFPETESIKKSIKVSNESIAANALEAISIGTYEGLILAFNIAGMLLVFISMIALINFIFELFGNMLGLNQWIEYYSYGKYKNLSLEYLLGTIFGPLMYLIGVEQEDSQLMGHLLGIKLVSSEFVAYTDLVSLKDIKNSIHLKYEKSIIMATYMLCGFANFASIGIQIAGIGNLAPNQRIKISKFGIKAIIAGSLTSLISATISGMLLA